MLDPLLGSDTLNFIHINLSFRLYQFEPSEKQKKFFANANFSWESTKCKFQSNINQVRPFI